MKESMHYSKWTLNPKDLVNIDAPKARDLIIKCMLESQKETFFSAKVALGKEINNEEIEKSILGAVRMVFREIGDDFSQPTKAGLTKVINMLAKKAHGWGTPKEIIEPHFAQMKKVISAIK